MFKSEPTFQMILVDGKAKWLSSDGYLVPVVSGGADDGDPPDPGKPPAEPPKTFTQEEVNKIMGEIRANAKLSTEKDLLKNLGVDDPDKAKELIAAARKRIDDEASDLDKAKTAQEAAEAKSKKADDDLAADRLTTAIEKALVRTGLSVEAAEKVRRMVTVEKNDTDLITAAIDDLKKDMPSLFESGSNNGQPGSNPGGPPRDPAKPNDPAAQAKATLFERHPNLKKT